MISVFEFDNFQNYINECYTAKRAVNPNFSIRAWSLNLGFTTHGQLNQILLGKRIMPNKYLDNLSGSMNLNETELQYLDLLLRKQRAKNLIEINTYSEKLREIKDVYTKTQNFYQIESEEYFADPYHSIIMNLFCLLKGNLTLSWIHDNLFIEITAERLERIINNLVKIGLVEWKDGSFLVKENGTTNSESISPETILNFHKVYSSILGQVIHKPKREERELNSYAFNLDRSKMDQAKNCMRKFLSDFIFTYGDNEANQSTPYLLNMHLFPISRNN